MYGGRLNLEFHGNNLRQNVKLVCDNWGLFQVFFKCSGFRYLSFGSCKIPSISVGENEKKTLIWYGGVVAEVL